MELLLNPEQYDLSPASTVAALRPAARNGDQRAIDVLAAVTRRADYQASWFLAADGLSKAAEAGNDVAIEALIGLLPCTNHSVSNAVVSGLKRAAANQHSKAAEALRLKGVQ